MHTGPQDNGEKLTVVQLLGGGVALSQGEMRWFKRKGKEELNQHPGPLSLIAETQKTQFGDVELDLK